MANIAKLFEQLSEDWSNYACYGYCIIAMEAAGFSKEKINEVIYYLGLSFEDYSLEAAKKKWIDY